MSDNRSFSSSGNESGNSISGQKEVKSGLRKTLWIKYKIKDNELFEKAYSYIIEFY